jgi:acetyl-CoA C-acetyltransferase
MGCVLAANLGQAPARQSALGAGLPVAVPATTVNKVCGSGLKAVMLAADGLALGRFQVAVAGGMECMSNAPYLIPTGRTGNKAGHVAMLDHLMRDGLEDAYETGRAMGTYAEDLAARGGFGREPQDAYAAESVRRARHAVDTGAFDAETIAVTPPGAALPVTRDEIPGKIDPAKIPRLKPAFAAKGTVTAASSSANGDAAAALVLSTRAHADKLHMPVLATLRSQASFARSPAEFTQAPTGAIRDALRIANWRPQEVDLYEINEAFAVVVLDAMRELDVRHERVNVLGGACALGHPIGASGARVLVTLLNAMRLQGARRGVASLCIGGGEAVAVAVEAE